MQHQRSFPTAPPEALVAAPQRADDVVAAVRELRRAEAHLVRRRQTSDGLSDIDRTALRLIIEMAAADRPATPKDLAEHLGVSTASVTSLLDRLLGDALIETRPHSADRRKKVLLPTAGTEHPDHDDPLASAIRGIADDLSDTEAQLLIGVLTRITSAVDDAQHG